MNTIRHGRKRPRYASVNFRVLGWLLRMEAARTVLYGRAFDDGHEARIRVAMLSLDGRHLFPRACRELKIRSLQGRQE